MSEVIREFLASVGFGLMVCVPVAAVVIQAINYINPAIARAKKMAERLDGKLPQRFLNRDGS